MGCLTGIEKRHVSHLVNKMVTLESQKTRRQQELDKTMWSTVDTRRCEGILKETEKEDFT